MPLIAHGNFTGRSLIIFGCGYVGAELARQAAEAGAHVTALTRNREKAAALERLGVRVVVDDLASDAWHGRLPSHPDFVLNAVSSGGAGLDGYRHSYVDGMRSILKWTALAGPVGTLVYTSSTSVYPQGGGGIVDEDAPTAGCSERGQILLEAERLLRESKQPAVNVRDPATIHFACQRYFILRLAGIYGPHRHYLLEQIRSGDVAGNGSHRLNLAHRDDIVAAIRAAFAAPAEVADEIFNVADDAAAEKAAVVDWLAGCLGVPTPRFSGVPAGTRRSLTPDRIISNAKLKNVLGWAPRYPSFREGYDQILANPE